MTQIVSTNSVQGDFHNVTLTNDGTRFVLKQRSNEFWAHVERVARVPPGDPWPRSLSMFDSASSRVRTICRSSGSRMKRTSARWAFRSPG